MFFCCSVQTFGKNPFSKNFVCLGVYANITKLSEHLLEKKKKKKKEL